MNRQSLAAALWILVPAWVFLLYQSGLQGPFVFDDIPNITANSELKISALTEEQLLTAVSAIQAGPLGRPVAYLSFSLNYYFFGTGSFSFKLTNLVIHMLNGAAIYALTRLLLRGFAFARRWPSERSRHHRIAAFTAVIWLVHPIALTSVLYTVQRMNSLSAGFSLLTMIFYYRARLQLLAGRIPALSLGLGAVSFALALLSKENAVLVPYLILVGEFCLLNFTVRRRRDYVLAGLLACSTVIPLVAGLFMLPRFMDFLEHSYALRPFTLGEHVLTEARAIWFYLRLIVLPTAADFGLYHDDFELSRNLLSPATTLPAVTGTIVLTVAAIGLRRKTPVMSFALLFYLTGHALESSVLSLEPVHEHRNYLPSFGLIFGGVYLAFHPALTARPELATGARVLLIITLLGFSAVTFQRARTWENPGSLSVALAQNHPQSARSNYAAGYLFVRMIETVDDPDDPDVHNYYSLARDYFTRAADADPANPSASFGRIYLDAITGKPVDPEVLAELRQQLADHPILPSTANAFTHLQSCWLEQVCRLSSSQLAGLYEAALGNGSGTRKNRSSLVNELAIVRLRENNPGEAMRLFELAVETHPGSIQLWINLVTTLINNRDLDTARDYLLKMRSRFDLEADIRQIEALETLYEIYRNMPPVH